MDIRWSRRETDNADTSELNALGAAYFLSAGEPVEGVSINCHALAAGNYKPLILNDK